MTPTKLFFSCLVAALTLTLSVSTASALSQNTIYSSSVGTCAFQYQYGNFWTIPYAKVRMTNGGCSGGTAVQTSYRNGAYKQSDADTSGSPSAWAQANGPQYWNILVAAFYVGDNTGHTRCIEINAVNGQVLKNYVVYQDYCD